MFCDKHETRRQVLVIPDRARYDHGISAGAVGGTKTGHRRSLLQPTRSTNKTRHFKIFHYQDYPENLYSAGYQIQSFE